MTPGSQHYFCIVGTDKEAVSYQGPDCALHLLKELPPRPGKINLQFPEHVSPAEPTATAAIATPTQKTHQLLPCRKIRGWSVTCSNPPRSSVVSIALFTAMIFKVWPVRCARSWTKLVLPTEAGPTRMTIQLICAHFMTDSSDCKDWCRSDRGRQGGGGT